MSFAGLTVLWDLRTIDYRTSKFVVKSREICNFSMSLLLIPTSNPE